MSSIFKSVISTFNGSSKNNSDSKMRASDNEPPGEGLLLSGSNGAQEPVVVASEAKHQLGNAKQANFGKRGRKKLSAMMGKISSSKNNSSQNGQPAVHNKMSRKSFDFIHNGVRSKNKDSSEQNGDNNLTDEADMSEFLDAQEEFRRESSFDEDDPKANFLLPEEECDIPTFLHTKNCDHYLIEETRKLLKERYAKSPEAFYDADYKRMLSDDWTVSRFLLRRRLDPKRTAKLMEECGRFRKQYKMSEVQLWEFPIEFHKAGGLFKYAPDRVGNVTVYMRVRMYRRVPEISDVFKAFILCVLEQCDTANSGRGTAVIFDLSGCGLQNVDLGFLSWLLSSFRNYCPKGVSYIIVYNLPWILSATCKLAMTWMSASNRRALRFVHGDEIEHFIARENLPDYLGGTCKINYRSVPEGSLPATEVCDRLDMTREQAIKIRELFKEYLDEEDYAKAAAYKQQQEESKRQQQEGSTTTTGV